jgi:hypothetical protein
MMGRLSPEGDRIAFVSVGTGNREIYVMSVADRRRIRVSTDGGWHPKWGRDGGELFFVTPRGEMMRATLERSALSFTAPPAVMFRPCVSDNRLFDINQNDGGFDVPPDATRFLVTCLPQDARPSSMTVVVNWQSKLR